MKSRQGIFAADLDDKRAKYGSLLQRLALHSLEPASDFPKVPFDYYCPTVRDQLSKRICKTCSYYVANLAAAARHRKNVHSNQQHIEDDIPFDEADVEAGVANVPILQDDDSLPLTNIFDIMSEFTTE